MAKPTKAYFAEAELNRYLAGGSYVGSGLSFWDRPLDGTLMPAWALHVGFPLSRSARHPAFFVAEGRLFIGHSDDVSSSYQVWGGVRLQFEP
jgi:hypothetical protein